MNDEFELQLTTESDFDDAIKTLRVQITQAIAEGENFCAKRDIAMLEKLQSMAKDNPKTLSPIELVQQRRKERDRLFAVLERRLQRLVEAGD